MKKIISLLLCFLFFLPLPVSAAVFQDVQYVVDQADLLTDQEQIYLDNRAEEISELCGMDVLIAAVEDMDGETAERYAVSLNAGRNWWDSDNAILFLLALEEREWYIATFGETVNLFDDNSLDQLGYDAADYFSEGYWYEGFSLYLDDVQAHFLAVSRQDQPVNSAGYNSLYQENTVHSTGRKTLLRVLPVSVLIGLAAATVTILIMRYSMNTKRKQHSAGDYLTQGSYHLHRHQDIFLYSNVSKVRRQQNTNSGGSSVHRSSGSRSHGGRGGKF